MQKKQNIHSSHMPNLTRAYFLLKEIDFRDRPKMMQEQAKIMIRLVERVINMEEAVEQIMKGERR